MPNIQVLDQTTINKIAAGEVIERPASVVKELLENSIDAGATAVTIEIRDGGISFIRVTDNGSGISPDEISLAFLRHSTSKIRSAEDLFLISSLGFRGEALSSIAAVSQVEVITRMPERLTGIRYQIEGGKEKGSEEIGAPEGTTLIARNLFYNTPVRRKFLKTAMTEGSHVGDLVEKLALSHPEVSIRFIQNNQNKLYTSGNHSLRDIIYTIYGREIAANLLPVHKIQDNVSVTGFVGKPVIARNNRNFENYFINGRYIKSGILYKAIEEAYRPFMMQHKYPFTMLQLQIEPELLDVNIHPTKMELRFQNGELIFRIVRDAIAEVLMHRELIPEMNLEEKQKKKGDSLKKESYEKRLPRPEPFEQRRIAQIRRETSEGDSAFPRQETPGGDTDFLRQEAPGEDTTFLRQEKVAEESVRYHIPVKEKTEEKHFLKSPVQKEAGSEDKVSPRQLDLFEEQLLAPESRSRHRLIGQLFDTYWLVEFKDHLYMIDQHAAHEKVLYEQTMASLAVRNQASQMVDPPIILTLSDREAALFRQFQPTFQRLGFEIEPFGGREYAVRGVPDNLFSIAQKELLTELFDTLSEDTTAGSPELICERVALLSCKAAVKGNHSMTPAEADHLIDALLKLENPYACPHGRPTIVSMSKYELERKFKRIV